MNTRDEGYHAPRDPGPLRVSLAERPSEAAERHAEPGTEIPSDQQLEEQPEKVVIPPGFTHLGLTELSPTEWRVVDALRPPDDGSRVLGFIQRVGAAYEVTSLIRLRERSYFSSFDRAAASLNPRQVLA